MTVRVVLINHRRVGKTRGTKTLKGSKQVGLKLEIDGSEYERFSKLNVFKLYLEYNQKKAIIYTKNKYLFQSFFLRLCITIYLHFGIMFVFLNTL